MSRSYKKTPFIFYEKTRDGKRKRIRGSKDIIANGGAYKKFQTKDSIFGKYYSEAIAVENFKNNSRLQEKYQTLERFLQEYRKWVKK